MAERQDWVLVRGILDYRNAQVARDLFNGGTKGFQELQCRPELQRLMLELHRAQLGTDRLALEDVMGALEQRAAERDAEADE